MQELFKIYYGKSLKGLVDQTFTNQIILNKILYLKRKKQEADALKKERGNIGKLGIRVMNRLAARTDDNSNLYNKNVVPDLEGLMVPYDKYQYRDSPYIDRKFESSQNIEQLLRNKFQKNSNVKKTDAEIEAILATTQHLINRTGNPQLSLQSLANSSPNDSIFNDIVDNSLSQTEMEIEQAQDENDQIDSLINNGSSSSSSGSGVEYVGNKRRKLDDEDEFTNNLLKGNFDNINNDPNAYGSNQSSHANMNANLLNPLSNS
jgi:hypothetical protein